MIGLEFESPEDLLEWIQAPFDNMPKTVIEKVFAAWLEPISDKVCRFIRCPHDLPSMLQF
jgi:hypothetical protein